MVIDRDKHNKYVATGFQPVQQVTEGTTLQSNTGNTSSTTSGSAGTSTIVINGGGGMTNALEEKLSGIEAGALVNLNAYSNITILNGTVEEGTITALAETDTARISTITPIVCSLVDGVIQLTFDDTNYATKLYVIDSIDDLIGAAPGALDTLEELALALGDDPNFATTVTNMIANVSNRVDTIEDTYAKLTDITVANITDLNSNWDSLLLNPPTDYITRWPSWEEVTDKPTTFTPSEHTHLVSDITNFPTTWNWTNITNIPSWITSTKPTYTWNEVINKPTWIGDTKPTYTAEEIGALTLAAADDLYVSITGDTMTGTLTVPTICVRGASANTPAPGQIFKLLLLLYGNLSVGDISIDNATIYLNNNIAAGGEIRLTTVSENTLYYNNAHVLTSENYGQYIDIDAGGITQDFADSRYVNVAGDTMTGSLHVNGDITIPVTKATVDGSVPYAGSTLTISGMDLLSNYKSFMGGIYINPNWYFGISVRHRNGYGDGNLYGLWLYTTLTAAGSLAYKKQQGTWTTERTLLDSVNYTGLIGNSFVKKSGDTMTGKLTISTSGGGNQLLINNTAGGETCFYLQSAGENKGAFTTMQPSYGTCIFDATSLRYLGIKTNGTPHFQGYTLWHAGNDGSGSGLDADLLDGVHNGNVTAIRLDGLYTGGGGMQQPSYFARRGKGIFLNMMNQPVAYSDVIYIDAYGGLDVPYVNAIAFQKASGAHGTVYHARAAHNGSSWGTWYPFIDSYNIGSYNAGSATKLRTARTITLSGAVTGSASFDGTANVTIATKYKGNMPYLISGNNSVLNPTLYNSTMFILLNGTSNSTRTVNLPSLGMMLTYVGSTSSWFAVLLTIVTCNTNYGTWAITKPATASGAVASNYYPKYFYNMSGGNVSLLSLSGPGKRMQILLYYHGSTDYTAQQIS